MGAENSDKDHSTKERILQAAGSLFGEKGLFGTRVREICSRAEVNLASVNYHFRSKAELYCEVWKRSVELADSLYPIDGGISRDASAEERLRGSVGSFIGRMTDRKNLYNFHRIRLMEMVNPTGLLDESLREMIEAKRGQMMEILRGLVGPGAPVELIRLCHMSIISQCLMVNPIKRDRGIKPLIQFSERDIEELTEHVIRFSLGGIRAVCGVEGMSFGDERKQV